MGPVFSKFPSQLKTNNIMKSRKIKVHKFFCIFFSLASNEHGVSGREVWADQLSRQIFRPGAIRLSRKRKPSRSVLRHSYTDLYLLELLYYTSELSFNDFSMNNFLNTKIMLRAAQRVSPQPHLSFWVFYHLRFSGITNRA